MNRLVSLFLLLSLLVFLDVLPKGQAQTANRAALVIQFDNARVLTFCISFSEPSISGHELLKRSGLPVVSAIDPLGYAVCKINQVGCPEEDCFCQSPPNYWSYWHLNQNTWVYSAAGSSSYTIQNGAVDGWVWGPGPGYPPPALTFDQVCNPTPTPINTPTATSTATPTASQTATATTPPSPTPTPSASATTKPRRTPRQSASFLPSTPTTPVPQNSPVPTASSTSITPATSTFLPTVTPLSSDRLQASIISTPIQPTLTDQSVEKSKKRSQKVSPVEAEEIKLPAKATQAISSSVKQSLVNNPTSIPITNSFPVQRLGTLLRYSIFGLLVLGLSVGLGVLLLISRR